MKGIIIYKGKYGATQQYAEWLSTELNLPVVPADRIKGKTLYNYDFYILGCSVYIGKLQLQPWLRKNLPFLQGKKIFFFQVAGAPPAETEKREAYNRSGIPAELACQCTYYFLPGKMNLRKLSWKDRFMLKAGAWLSKSKTEKQSMLAEYNNVKAEHLDPVIRDVRDYLRPVSRHWEKRVLVPSS